MNHWIKLVILFGFSITLQGCVTATVLGTAIGLGAKVVTDPRSTGTQIDDETLEEKVLHNIQTDAQIKEEGRVNVVSYNGRILLIGQVPQESLKEMATNLAEGVNGVNTGNVYNQLRIGTPITSGQISKDAWITTQVKTKILTSNAVRINDVKVITENGEVFLMGNVTQSQANAAVEIAANVSGVQKVIKVFKYLN